MKSISLLPAYGRDFTTAKAALAAFHADKDFILVDMTSPWNGKPCNKRDLKRTYTSEELFIEIRYKQLRSIAVVKLDCLVKNADELPWVVEKHTEHGSIITLRFATEASAWNEAGHWLCEERFHGNQKSYVHVYDVRANAREP